MAHDNVSIPAAREMKTALDHYYETVSQNLEDMKKAAYVCRDTMKSDSISMEMVAQLEDSMRILQNAVNSVKGLSDYLKNEIGDDVDTYNNFARR